jgi:hypothetical protein
MIEKQTKNVFAFKKTKRRVEAVEAVSLTFFVIESFYPTILLSATGVDNVSLMTI